VSSLIATGRAFLEEAEKRQDQFITLGLPPTFIRDFGALVDGLEQAVKVRLNSKTLRKQAKAGVASALARGFDSVLGLDVVVANATRHDPVLQAAWKGARRIEGQRTTASGKATTPVATAETTEKVAAVQKSDDTLGAS